MEEVHRQETTAEKLRKYNTATQANWKIKHADEELYALIFEALAANTRVKKLKILCNWAGGIKNETLFKLADAIERNNSLECLSLHKLLQGTSQGIAAVLSAFANKPKIKRLDFEFQEEVTPLEWDALLNFLRAHPHLQRLSLYNVNLTEEQTLQLIQTLKEYTALKYLDLRDQPNEETIVSEIMQNTISLSFIIPNSTSLSETKQEKVRHQQMNSIDDLKQPSEPILMPDLTGEPTIKQLSNDILRVILWQLSIKSVVAFRKVDKQFYKFTKDNSFWRGYYTTHFYTIPYDVLLLTDLTYGLKLVTADLTCDIFRTFPFWEEIFINSFLTRKISPAEYPVQLGLPFMEIVYRTYPQLIGTAISSDSFDVLPPDRKIFKYKDSPYAQTWFLLYVHGSPTMAYHLGFEKLADGQYNGILFRTPDFPASWRERFKHTEYIFDWFAAKNEAEFSQKMKKLCEPFLAAREQTNVYTPNQNSKISELLQSCINERKEAISAINNTIELAAKNFCNSHERNFANPNPRSEFVQHVENLVKKFKEFTESSESEVDRLHQNIPPRSSFNEKYWDGRKFHNFHTHSWEYKDENTKKIKQPKNILMKQKTSKSVPIAAVMKFYRVVLNFILMPVLRTFWLADIDHPDYEIAMFSRCQESSLPLYRHLYYSNQYVPFSDVSIGKAHPAQWPMIAIGLAQQLLPLIIPVANELMDGYSLASNGSICKLIDVLDLMPIIPSSVKIFLQTLS